MCGINGIFNYNGISPFEIADLVKMNKDMSYRGPDENDVWSDDMVGLAHVRLSIIGVDNGHQPIFNEDSSLILICNGEIYNYKELRNNLSAQGHIFTTKTDSEVILHLYEEKGINCLDYLRGMFAFAIYNKSKQEVFIARDRVGLKTLYYSISNKNVIFSSELKSIQNVSPDNIEYDFNVVRHSLQYSHPIDLTKTHVKKIKRIQPGQYAIISKKGISKNFYWQKKNTYNYKKNFESAKLEILALLKESVSLRMQSDVPIAVLLSGGIDSSAIAILARELNQEVHAITIGYKGSHIVDEREQAKKLCKDFDIKWHNIELDKNDFSNYFDEYINFIDEPVCDVAAIAQWGMYKKAKELGFKVLLSGNGGDEIFYGYQLHNQSGDNLQLLSDYNSKFITQERTIKNHIQFLFNNMERIKLFLKTYTPHFFDRNFIRNYQQFCYKWNDYNKEDANINTYFSNEKYSIDGVYSFLFKVWLQANCYYLSDRLGMGNSIEIRAPFSDHQLIELISSLPLDYRYKKNNPKWLLKEILHGIVPDEVLFNKKKGFTPPYENIAHIVRNYNSVFFKTKLFDYNQVVVDKLLKKEL